MKEYISKYRPLVIVITAFIAVLLLVISKPTVKPETSKYLPPLVRLEKVNYQDIEVSIYSQGTVVPGKEIVFSSEISGKINWVSNKLLTGSQFNKNDILITFDKRDFELALIVAESNLSQAKLNYEREFAEYELAKKEWEQIGQGRGSSLTLREPQINRAKALLASAEAGYEQAQRNLDRCTLRAPFNGIVKAKNVDIGTVAGPGVALAYIYSIDYVEIELQINQNEFSFLNSKSNYKKNKVILSNESYGSFNNWIGSIDRISNEINPRTRMQSVYATVSSPYKRINNQPPLKVGMYVDAEIIGEKIKNGIKIQRDLINNNKVWIVNNNELEERQVEILFYDKEFAIIKEGLKGGEQILLTQLSIMVDKMKVRVK